MALGYTEYCSLVVSINQKEKNFRQVTKCLHQRLTWCNRTGQVYDTAYYQFLYIGAIVSRLFFLTSAAVLVCFFRHVML